MRLRAKPDTAACRKAARRRFLLTACAALAGSVVAIGGCGYSPGSLTSKQYRRVYLPLFENRTYYRDLEIELTRQVEKELATRPGISIVPRERADIVLAGTIVDFTQRVLSEDRRDVIRESSTVTRVQIEVQDPRTGKVARRFEVSDSAEFVPARGETLASAATESFFDLARHIVDGLEDDFPHASPEAHAR